VLTEPALTNIGIVLPAPGFLETVAELSSAAGSLLIVDETHTLSAGPGGCTGAWSLDPDIVTLGKAIGGGIPAGAYGLRPTLAEQITGDPRADLEDVGGVGGTLAGNPLSVSAMRATLEQVLTGDAFAHMSELGRRFVSGVTQVIENRSLPWCVVGLGARAEVRFCPEPPTSGGAAAAAADDELDELLHLYLANRGILITPFHNMALMCPTTTADDVDRHTAAFDELAGELV
jgi:glutamate-1-semialdehyde 2,1-aminomutase